MARVTQPRDPCTRIPPLYLGIDVSSGGIDRPRTGGIALRPRARRGIKAERNSDKMAQSPEKQGKKGE